MIMHKRSTNKYNAISYILAADDDLDDQELIKDALSDSDFNTDKLRFVSDGEELMSTLINADSLPSIILLDLNMPKKNGREALAEIKANTSLRHIPVIIFSTSDSTLDIKECYSLGTNAYMTKPNNYKDLVETMQILLDYWIGRSQIVTD